MNNHLPRFSQDLNAPLLISAAQPGTRETDCACTDRPSNVTCAVSRTPPDAPYVQVPGAFTAALPHGFHAVMSPTAPHGPSVVNAAGWKRWQQFGAPRAVAHDFDRQLAAQELIRPLGARLQLHEPEPATLTAWLHVTNACNLRCTYCYVNKTADQMSAETGRQAVDAILRSAQANHFERVKIKYAGGEATLNFAHVLALHEYARTQAACHNLDLDGVVLSNGVAWNQRMIAALKAHDLRLMISLDGIGAAHDGQRPFASGHGSFTHVVRTLDRLASAGVTPTVSVTLTDNNLDTLPETVDFLLQRQLPFTLNLYRANDCVTSPGELTLRDDRVIEALHAAFAVIKANLPPFSLLGCLADLAQVDAIHDRPCGADHNYLVIGHTGQVARCHMELDHPVTDVTAGDPLLTLRTRPTGWHNGPVTEKTGCQTCTWRYWCAGGCPLLTYRTTGRWDVQSPYCRVYKAIFPEILRLEGLRLLHRLPAKPQ